ncbi:ExbD/TolR family protein [Planctomicrobium piriforme]|uniref:Biopolymer transport protein ExbD n=1 Tax=Planctomicrobium piriforme TaxID=1576369 RepID=A0A1I3B3H8_9PLAN|nr:biopolymer transporter ExbD [Planctomicrobium piriforme]SFH56499.1 biopolymer transport protein ExbD [Planctomicrobium piriforme]
MKIPSRVHRDHDFGAMTSMIDVVLFLLMFFVVTAGSGNPTLLLPAPLAKSGSIESAEATAQAEPSSAVDIWLKLHLEAASRTTLVDMNGTTYSSLEEIKQQLAALAELDKANPIIFDTAPEVPLGDLVSLYDACQAAGFESISFAAKATAAP